MEGPVELWIGNIPFQISAAELVSFLETYIGNDQVEKCEIKTNLRNNQICSKGFGFATIKEPGKATLLFEMAATGSLGCLLGRRLLVKRSQRRVTLGPRHLPETLERLHLQIGSLVNDSDFCVLWASKGISADAEFHFERGKLMINLKPQEQFVHVDHKTREYRLEFRLKDLEYIETTDMIGTNLRHTAPLSNADSTNLLVHARQPPQVFYREMQSKQSSSRPLSTGDVNAESGEFSSNDITFGCLRHELFQLLSSVAQTFLQDRFLYNIEEAEVPWTRGVDFTGSDNLGQSFAYHLSLSPTSLHVECPRFRQVLDKLVDYKLADDPPIPRKLRMISSSPISADSYGELCRRMPYDVFFQLTSLMQRGIICRQGITHVFLEELSRLAPMEMKAILNLIDNAEEFFYDPMHSLRDAVRRLTEEFPGARHADVVQQTWKLPEGLMQFNRVHITPVKTYCLGPEVDSSNRVTRQYSHLADSFLRASFVEEHGGPLAPEALSLPVKGNAQAAMESRRSELYYRIHDVLCNGIKIGQKTFKFLAFSSSQLREQSVWMFATSGETTAESIREWMGDFSNFENVAKCAARMGQCFSSSKETVHVYSNEVDEIPDITTKLDSRDDFGIPAELNYHLAEEVEYNFSDGIGTMTAKFAEDVWAAMGQSSPVPSAFQIRYAGAKGVVAVHPDPFRAKLCLRKSMKKFPSPHSRFEVLDWSRFRPCYLNRQIIILMSTLGIDDNVFLSRQRDMVQELNSMLTDPACALRVLESCGARDVMKTAVHMLSAGFDPEREPHLRALLQAYRAAKLLDLRTKSRIFIPRGRVLMGCLDEYGILQYGQVFLQVTRSPQAECRRDDGLPWSNIPSNERNRDIQSAPQRRVVVGRVVVAKNPCLHPGDVRVLEAVDSPLLHHLVDCVVFPQKGHRPHPNECSGSDLDGDLYFVSWDCDLVPTRTYPPMDYQPASDIRLGRPVQTEDLATFFVDYMVNDSLGIISNAHLVHADRSALKASDPKCLELAKLASTAVDFPKTGKPAVMPVNLRVKEYPDFMEKENKDTYPSSSVLGKLYQSVMNTFAETGLALQKVMTAHMEGAYSTELETTGFIEYVEEARMHKSAYDDGVAALMNRYGIQNEAEIVSGNILSFNRYYQRRQGDAKDRVLHAMAVCRKQVRDWVDSNEDGDEEQTSRNKASALYHVTYHPRFLKSRKNKGNLKGQVLLSLPWVVADILASIKVDAAQ